MLLLFSSQVMSNCLWPHELQHPRPPCPSPNLGIYSNSCPLSWWCYLTISFSAVLFSLCLQSFPALVSFPMSWLFASDSQNTGASALALVLPMNILDWFPLGWTGLISFLSKGLSSINSLALSLLYGPTLTSLPDYWKNHSFDYTDVCWQNYIFAF